MEDQWVGAASPASACCQHRRAPRSVALRRRGALEGQREALLVLALVGVGALPERSAGMLQVLQDRCKRNAGMLLQCRGFR